MIYYPQSISETILEEEIPALYGMDVFKFKMYMEKTSSHTFKSTAAYWTKTGIKCILCNEMPVKSLERFFNELLRFRFNKTSLEKTTGPD